MNRFLILAALLLPATSAFSQWSIVSVTAERNQVLPSKVSEDMFLRIALRNDSDRTLYIWGQSGYYQVEAFIKDSKSMVWERKNSWMCGTAGEPSWQPVEAGREIKVLRREAIRDAGRSMMLTFRMAYSPIVDATGGSEILLGEFKIPAVPPDK